MISAEVSCNQDLRFGHMECTKTRPRRPGFKGHPIEFMIFLDPYFGPLETGLNPFGPINTQLAYLDPFSPVWKTLDQFGSTWTYSTLFRPI